MPKEKRAEYSWFIENLGSTWGAISVFARCVASKLICVYEDKVTVMRVYAINDETIVTINDNFFEQLNDEVTQILKWAVSSRRF